MPRIRCHYLECTFNDELFCSAAAIEINPETGCATFSNGEIEEDGKIILDEDLEDGEEENDEDEDEEDEEPYYFLTKNLSDNYSPHFPYSLLNLQIFTSEGLFES